MPQLLDSNGKSFQNTLRRRPGEPHDPFGCSDEEKNLCPCLKFVLVIHPVASHYTILKYLVIKNEISDIILNLISTTVLLKTDTCSHHIDFLSF